MIQSYFLGIPKIHQIFSLFWWCRVQHMFWDKMLKLQHRKWPSLLCFYAVPSIEPRIKIKQQLLRTTCKILGECSKHRLLIVKQTFPQNLTKYVLPTMNAVIFSLSTVFSVAHKKLSEFNVCVCVFNISKNTANKCYLILI